MLYPTAQTSFVPATSTAFRRLEDEPGLGLGTSVHAVPFHRSMTVAVVDEPREPTAQTSFAAATATALRLVDLLLVRALGTTFHVPGTEGEVVEDVVVPGGVVGGGFATRL
jgi:hypothetical protein